MIELDTNGLRELFPGFECEGAAPDAYLITIGELLVLFPNAGCVVFTQEKKEGQVRGEFEDFRLILGDIETEKYREFVNGKALKPEGSKLRLVMPENGK